MRVEAQVKTEAPATPILLTPSFVERMIARRQAVQIVRFRTTCTDCVPNMQLPPGGDLAIKRAIDG